MAYRKSSYRSRTHRSASRASRSRGRFGGGRRASRGGVRRGNSRVARGSAHTLRIVMEHPASNPMMTVPVGMQQATASPRGGKSAF